MIPISAALTGPSKFFLIFKVATITLIATGLLFAGFYFWKATTGQTLPGCTIVGEPIVMRTKGGLMEVSLITSNEQITQVFPGFFVDTAVTVTVPATYRYQIELAPEWKFMRHENMFVVVAPKIKPQVPAAFNTAGMTVNANLPFSFNQKLAVLQQVTPLLNSRANTYIPRQKEMARKTVSEFVKKWVLEQERFKNEKNLKVLVLFDDEPIFEILKDGPYPLASS